MESRLKERLTGAAILVAIIVLVVPEIFHERRSATEPADRPAASPTAAPAPAAPGSAVPTRSYTIDLTPSVPPAHTFASTPTIPATRKVGPRVSEAPAVAPASPEAPAVTARAAVPQGPQERAGDGRSEPHGAGGWTVQLGLFAKEANAQRLARSAQSHGFAVGVTRYGSRGLYRVAVADVANRAAAEQLSHRLHGAGLPAAILGPR